MGAVRPPGDLHDPIPPSSGCGCAAGAGPGHRPSPDGAPSRPWPAGQVAADRRREQHRRRRRRRPHALGRDRRPGHRGSMGCHGPCVAPEDAGLWAHHLRRRLRLGRPAGAVAGAPGLRCRRGGAGHDAQARHRGREAAGGGRGHPGGRHLAAPGGRGPGVQASGAGRGRGRRARFGGCQASWGGCLRERHQALPGAGGARERHVARHPGEPERPAGLRQRRAPQLQGPPGGVDGLAAAPRPGRGRRVPRQARQPRLRRPRLPRGRLARRLRGLGAQQARLAHPGLCGTGQRGGPEWAAASSPSPRTSTRW